jgi:hypothetical protein
MVSPAANPAHTTQNIDIRALHASSISRKSENSPSHKGSQSQPIYKQTFIPRLLQEFFKNISIKLKKVVEF